jgi:hypothetical protein
MADYATLTNLTNALKTVYGDGLKNQFADEKTTYNLFPKSDRNPKGKGYTFGLRIARNQSTGGRSESGKLPDPMTGKKINGTITPAYLYGAIRITGPAIEAAKGNEAAFVDGLADEIEDIYQSILVDLNRQMHWDGFGMLGRASAASSAVSTGTYNVTFDNDLGIKYFIEGQLVDFYASAGDTTPGSTGSAVYAQRVTAVNPSTKVVTFEANATTYAANHPTLSTLTNGVTGDTPQGAVVVKMGTRDLNHAGTETPVELTGLYGMFDDGTLRTIYEGITVAEQPKWAANILSNSSVNRELSIDLMLQVVDVVRTASGASVKKMLMGLGQKRKYANLLMPDVRFQPGKLVGGYEVLTFSGGDGSVELIVDPLTQPNLIYAYPDDVIYKYEMSPLGWGNLDNSQLHQRAGYDEWDAFLRLYTQLGCEQRNCLCLLKDLVEPSLYS